MNLGISNPVLTYIGLYVFTGIENHIEYAHRDHSDPIEAVTDEHGNILDNMADEVVGSRKSPRLDKNATSLEIEDI